MNSTQITEIFEQAHELTQTAQYQNAIALLQKILSNFEKNQNWESYVHACNEIGKNYNHLSKTNEALHYLQSSLQIASNHLSSYHLQLAHAHNNIAYTYSLLGRFEEVLHHYQQALHIFQHHYVDNFHSDLAMINSNLGWFYGEKGDIPKAVIHHQRAVHIYLQTLGANDPQTAIAYNNTGYVYGLKNDYANAFLYYQQALNIWRQTLDEDHPQLIHAYNNIGWCKRMEEKIEEATHYYHKALQLSLRKFGEKHATTAQVYNNIGTCYHLQNDFKKSFNHYQQALQIQKKLYGNQHPSIAQSWMNMGIASVKQKEFEAGLDCLQKSLKQYQEFVHEKYPRIAMVYNEIGNAYRRSGQFEEAILSFHQVLQKVLPTYENATIEVIPSIENCSNENALLYALNGKAASFLGQHLENSNSENESTHSLTSLQTALGHFEAAAALIQQLRQSYKVEAAKLSLSKSILPVYEGAIQTAFALFEVTESEVYLQKAFHFSEQGKGMVLLGDLKNNEAIEVSDIPNDLQEKIGKLEIELRYLDKKITQEQNRKRTPKNSNLLRELQQMHFHFHEQYQALIETLEKDYTDYFQLKYATQSILMEEIQAQIAEQTAFVEYFIGEERIFVFVVTQQHIFGKSITKPLNFTAMVDAFHQAIEWMDEELFVETARNLYDLLLTPIEVHCQTKKEWLIIRDDALHLLPFDALLLPSKMPVEEEVNFEEMPYLIRYYTIAYHYSANLWQHSRKQALGKTALRDSFLGVAPVVFHANSPTEKTEAVAWATHRGKTKVLRGTESEEELQDLPSTALEVRQVYDSFQEKKMDGKLFLYAAASKQVFFEEVPKHKYVLIATHGFVHGEYQDLSGIYLANSPQSLQSAETKINYLLTLSEIYQLKLQADLVVLSSCSSGVGKLQKGEGMMALNRGFLYAGASNIIFTQFDIPDHTSSELVQNLFRYILNGESYPRALQKAKCDGIAAVDSSPKDWAGFAYIGALKR